jgi:hypothetical protein
MAIYSATDTEIVINSVNLSDHLTKATFTETAADVETTAFGDTNVTRIGGLKDGSVSLEFQQDYDASSVYATLSAIGVGGTTTLTCTPTSGALATTNPEVSVTVLITDLTFLDTTVGDLATFSVSWPFSGAVSVTTA